MRRFYAPPEQFDAQTVRLNIEETRHLRDVLRMRVGEQAQVFDGAGREFLVEITRVGKKDTLLEIVREIAPPSPESGLEIHLTASVYKNDKLDLVVQKAVELGVTRFTPIVTFRSEAKLQAASKRVERWRKIALEATKQCERAKVMEVEEPRVFEDFLANVLDGGMLLMFSEKDGSSIPEKVPEKKITALIGPKGGWEDSEIDLAVERGFVPIKLGTRIMKAETAAITFASLLQHRFGDLR